MNQINKEILDKYLVRKKYKEKTAFIDFLKSSMREHGYYMREQRFVTLGIKGRNLIFGDPNKAKYIIGAHYDTQASLGVLPNFCAPLNKSLTLFYDIALGVLRGVIGILCALPFIFLTHNLWYLLLIALVVCGFLNLLILFGPENKHTYNDNTSGVTSLVDLMLKMENENRNNVCFIFFDLEEIGLVGSRIFLRTHKESLKKQILINIDCVSDGTKMLGICKNINMSNLPKSDYIFADRKNAIYPSDQKGYPNYIAYTSLNESKKRHILYLDKIHTKRDTVYKEENIQRLTDHLKEIILANELNLLKN